MRVRSKLADVEFRFGTIERNDDELIINSHPDQPMKSRVYISAQDVVTALRALITSPAAWGFLVRLPGLVWRTRAIHTGRKPQG